jgi:hypothetical protein
MTITNIKDIMLPPSVPVELPDFDVWDNVEATLAISLPEEYKAFVSTYGSGSINEFIWIFNPAAKNENIEFLRQIQVRLGAIAELKANGERFPYELYPTENGIIPFAATDNGDVFFWKMARNEESWTIVINEGRSPNCEEYELSWSNFLMHLLSGKLHSKILPMSVFRDSPVFKRA